MGGTLTRSLFREHTLPVVIGVMRGVVHMAVLVMTGRHGRSAGRHERSRQCLCG